MNLTLGAGASTSLAFSWTPTGLGNHTLTASHDLFGDEVDNGTASAVVNVTEASAITVDSVCYSGAEGKNADKHLVSSLHLLLSGATVSITINSGSSGSRSGTCTTDANGDVAFSWKNANVGETYSTVVDAVNINTSVVAPDNNITWPDGIDTCSPS